MAICWEYIHYRTTYILQNYNYMYVFTIFITFYVPRWVSRIIRFVKNTLWKKSNGTGPCSTSHSGAIACQRSEKKGQHQKVDFFNEMWKIMGQIDYFGRFLNNSCNLGVFLVKNQKYLKTTVLKKWKLNKRRKKIWDWKTYFKYYIKHSYSMNLMILLICFVICNVLGHFLPF